MRVQHNITAMNSYRNYNNNTSTINKNIEKLSSGYKINRAGDNAAGLAISEKMRAQITGLEVAQKNAKDGISLVQTAEGALTEVHSMLNRMVELTEQSANGTYDNTTDRDQLQKEVSQLRKEIDRIAESANFNGIKLLDGSLSGNGTAAVKNPDVALSIQAYNSALDDGSPQTLKNLVDFTGFGSNLETAGGTNKVVSDIAAGNGATMDITIELSDGKSHTYSVTFGTDKKMYYDGEEVENTAVYTSNGFDAQFAKDIATILNTDSDFADNYSFDTTTAAKKITLESYEKEFNVPSIQNITVTAHGYGTANVAGNVTQPSKGAYKTLNFNGLDTYDAASETKSLAKSVFTINNQKFAFVKDAASANELGPEVNVVITSNDNADATDSTAMVKLMNQKLNTSIAQPDANATTTIDLISWGGYRGGGGQALQLQIGDTADAHNQLQVTINDIHTDALQIGSIDISTQLGATNAMDKIKAAINKVSDVRGTLGATQNRLEHTINNLSVMQQNIQDAESTIRDTDVADEMMKYTKNSILVQSAQAMLAQANQQPQGVLQLLQ